MKDENTQTNEWQPVEKEGKIADPTPCRINLFNPAGIRREMCWVYRDMRTGKIPTQDGTRLVYALDMIRKAYETEVLKERITLIEQTLKTRCK